MRDKSSYRSGKRNKMKGDFAKEDRAHKKLVRKLAAQEPRESTTQAGEPRGKSFIAFGGLRNFFFPGPNRGRLR